MAARGGVTWLQSFYGQFFADTTEPEGELDLAGDGQFRERVLDWSALPRSLKLFTGLGAALLIAIAFTILAQPFYGREAHYVFDGARTMTPKVVLGAAGILIAVATGFALSAVAFWRRRWLQILALVAYTSAALPFVTLPGPGLTAAGVALGLAGPWAIVLGPRFGLGRGDSPWLVPLMLAAVLSVPAVVMLGVSAETAAPHVTSLAREVATVLLGPVLVLSGADVADLAVVGGAATAWLARAASSDNALRQVRLAAVSLACVSVVLGVVFGGVEVLGVAILALVFVTLVFGLPLVSRLEVPERRFKVPTITLVLAAVASYLAVANHQTSTSELAPFGGIALVAWLAAIVVFPRLSQRPWWRQRPSVTFLLFVLLFALFVTCFGYGVRRLDLPLDFGLLAWALLAVVGACTLGYAALRRSDIAGLSTLVRLDAALIVLVLLAQLLETAASAGEALSEAQAVVVLIALGWELVVSGEHVNVQLASGVRVARQSRLLLFLGYMVATGAAILVLSPHRTPGAPTIDSPFDAERFARYGVLMLGFPLLAAVSAPGVSRLLGDRRTRSVPAVGRWWLERGSALPVLWIVGFLVAAVGFSKVQTWGIFHSNDTDFTIRMPADWTRNPPPPGTGLDFVGELHVDYNPQSSDPAPVDPIFSVAALLRPPEDQCRAGSGVARGRVVLGTQAASEASCSVSKQRVVQYVVARPVCWYSFVLSSTGDFRYATETIDEGSVEATFRKIVASVRYASPSELADGAPTRCVAAG